MLFTKAETDVQELLSTNTNLFIRIYVFQEDSIMSRFVLVFLPLLLAVSFLQERFEHSIIIMMTDFHSMVFNVHFSFFRMLWVIYRFMVILISLKT